MYFEYLCKILWYLVKLTYGIDDIDDDRVLNVRSYERKIGSMHITLVKKSQ